jgi:NADPH:quinone reductase
VSSVIARAARINRHGEPLQIEEVEIGQPGVGEVVVELAYAGVNPVDGYTAEGRLAVDGPVPRTLGGEASGRAQGRPVLVRGYGLGTWRDGLWATAAIVPEAALIDVPDGVGLAEASTMGVAGVTAWRTVTEKARVSADDRVLVLGASGGVGSIIVSLTRSIGAKVWAQTASRDKADWIRKRGAEEAVVADGASVAEAARELHPTVVFDPLGDGFFGAAVELLEERGRLVIFGASGGARGDVPLQTLYRKNLTVYGYGGLIESDEVMARNIAEGLRALADDRMEVVIDRVVPLGDVNEALSLLKRREVRGKLVLDPNL